MIFQALSLLLGPLLFLAILTAGAWIVGRWLLGSAAQGPEDHALAVLLGLGIFGTLALLLGLVGGLQPWTVALVLGVLVAGAGWRWRRTLPEGGTPAGRGPSPWMAGAVAIALLPLFAIALYPPTGFDATTYHLPYARAFAAAGEVSFLGDLRFPIFPQLNEMLFTLALLESGDRAAQLTQVLMALLTAAILWGWGRRLGAPRAGLGAAALWLGTPLVVWVGATGYIDIGLSAFGTAALACWDRGSRDGKRWLVWAAVFAGFAAASKYLGLFFVGALGFMTFFRTLRTLRTLRPVGAGTVWAALRPTVLFGIVALGVMAPWYLRILYHTGNPLFPFYGILFGGSEWVPAADAVLPPTVEGPLSFVWHQGVRVLEGLGFLLLTPWRGVFDRAVFHFQAPLSPWGLVLIPAALPCLLLLPRGELRATVWRGLGLTLAYGVFWLTTLREIRFLLPVMPVFGLCLFLALEQVWQRQQQRQQQQRQQRQQRQQQGLPRWGFLVLICLVLAPGPLYGLYKIAVQGPLPVTAEAQRHYLKEWLPGYGALVELEGRVGENYALYAIRGERLHYYARGRLFGAAFGPWNFGRVTRHRGDLEGLCRELQAMGADHYLEVRPSLGARVPSLLPSPDPGGCLERLSAGEGYRLYRLRPPP